MPNKEALVLSDMFQKTRDLTRWYLSLLKDSDPYKRWEVNGAHFNSTIWIASHITWAENTLLLFGTGGQPVNIDWSEHYNLGGNGTLHHPEHNMKAVMSALKVVHEKALPHLLTISDEKMDEPNVLGFGFGGITTNRILVQHAIRHEAMHTGHLSWLCKINKLQTV